MSRTVFTYSSNGLEARLKRSTRKVVQSVSFSVESGEKMALIGETGSGKTLTALSVMGLLPRNMKSLSLRRSLILADGRKVYDDEVDKEVGRSLVYIPQNGLEFLNPARSIGRQLYDMVKLNYPKGTDLKEKAVECLELSGLEDAEGLLGKYPHQLSGGMAQRVTIALSMTGRASLVIADEPTNGLDENGRRAFLSLLDSHFPDAGKIIITHDMSLAALTDSLLVLKDGSVMEQGTTREILRSPRCGYTKALIAALVENGMAETPVLRAQEGNCPFYSRCREASAACMEADLRTDGAGSWRCING